MLEINFSDENSLKYFDEEPCLAPIPISERALPSAIAKPYFKVGDSSLALEGPAFDKNGNLLFLDIYAGRVLCLSTNKKLTTIYQEKGLNPTGIAIHKDGRIFLACVGEVNSDNKFHAGSVIALDAAGKNRRTIVSPDEGYVIDDLVFDSEGGFYFTDFKGSSTSADGGLYYVSPDYKKIIPVLPKMCAANGVALSPDGKVVWVTEYCANRLHRVELSAPGIPARGGISAPYTFQGRAPDSMRCDANGNVYVAMNWQARVLVFSPFGIPIGQILLPGRDKDKYLKSTSLAIFPDLREMVIVARDVIRGEGAMIFAAKGLGNGLKMFSHQ